MNRHFLFAIALAAVACGGEQPAPDVVADVPRYRWQDHRDPSREAEALQSAFGLFMGPLGLARVGEVRDEVARLAAMRETGQITPGDYTQRSIDFMDRWLASHPEHIARLQQRHPERVAATLDRIRELRVIANR